MIRGRAARQARWGCSSLCPPRQSVSVCGHRPWTSACGPTESAQAAAKYLEYLHGQFKDWRLALAAYNAGEGTVQRLMKQHNAKTFDGIATHLPAETQMYVPRVEATLARREGVKLSELHLPKG